MNEPDNHTAWRDDYGTTWVRVDELPGLYGPWHAVVDDPGWEARVRQTGPVAGGWAFAKRHGPLTPVGAEEAALAVERVRQAMTGAEAAG
jgi:hypothetical protein